MAVLGGVASIGSAEAHGAIVTAKPFKTTVRSVLLKPRRFSGVHRVSPIKHPQVHEQGGEGGRLRRDPRARLDRKPGQQTRLRGLLAKFGLPEVPRANPPAFSAARTDPMQFFTRSDLGQPPATGFPMEPQAAAAGDVVFYSGNSSGAFSVDGGATFTFVQPDVMFGAVDGGFCCDTMVRYAPSVNRFLWLIQYWCAPNPGCPGTSGNSNRYRLAVASPQAIRANASNPAAAWVVYDLTTGLYNGLMKKAFKDGPSWFDKPDMAVGRKHAYLTWNVVGRGTINIRINLADLAAGRTANSLAFAGTDIFWRTAQNPGTTGIWIKNGHTDSSAVVYTLADSSNGIVEHRVSHTALPTDDYSSLTSLGEDWTARASSSAPGSATVRGGELWIAWNAARNYKLGKRTVPVLPQPHIQIAVYSLKTFKLIRELDYWNSGVAILSPALATNSQRDVAISFSYGGPNNPPGPGVGFLTGHLEGAIAATADPVSGQGQGDYASLQPDFPDTSRFVSGGYVSRSNSGVVTNRWAFIRFGRASAGPPAPPSPPAGGTSMSLVCPSGGVNAPGPVAVSGVLAPQFAGAQIRIHIVGPPAVGTFDRATTTDLDGNYRDSFGVTVGSYTVQAHFAGGSANRPSDSPSCTVIVRPPPG
ncbi:MAG: hypothetical protein ACXVXL_23030 [Solirubrobacteraceae bacterium]